jgi:hypothetical protein
VHVARGGEGKRIHNLEGKKPEGQTALAKPRRRWEQNIKMDLQDLGWGMDWIDLAEVVNRWSAVVNEVMNLRFQ